MKRIYKQFIALAALLALPLTASAVTGDVTGDGTADIDDVNMIINEMLGQETGLDCDANHDGNVDVDDLNLVINVLLGLVPEGITPEDETFTVEGVEFKVIYVEGGTFTMGGESRIVELADYAPYLNALNRNLNYSKPAHEVTLTSYKIMETEVIQGLFYALMGDETVPDGDDYYYNNWYNNRDDRLPEQYCSWEQAVEFANRLSAATGRTFRLPTEAEWEYAARGGQKSQDYIFPGGDYVYNVGNVHTADNYLNSYREPKAFTPNELGIYDMAGNVLEWCLDEYRWYTEDPQTDPVCGGGNLLGSGNNAEDYRVYRGGDKDCRPYSQSLCTVVGRGGNTKTFRQPGYGFRLVVVD